MDFGQHSAEEPLLPGGGGFVRYDQTVTEVLAPIEEALKTFKLSRNAGTKAAFFKALSGQLTRLAEPGVTDVYDHLAKVFMFLRENSDSIGIVAHTRYLDVPERDRQKIAPLLVSIIANREADLTKAALDLPSGSGDGSAGESKDDPSGSENTHDRLSQIKDTLLPAVDLRILVSSLKILLDINPPECDKKRNFYTARRIELRLEVVMFLVPLLSRQCF